MVNTLHMVLNTTQLSMNIEHYSNHYSSQAFNNKAHARRTWNWAKGEKNIRLSNVVLLSHHIFFWKHWFLYISLWMSQLKS